MKRSLKRNAKLGWMMMTVPAAEAERRVAENNKAMLAAVDAIVERYRLSLPTDDQRGELLEMIENDDYDLTDDQRVTLTEMVEHGESTYDDIVELIALSIFERHLSPDDLAKFSANYDHRTRFPLPPWAAYELTTTR
jgi:hypothetical protein